MIPARSTSGKAAPMTDDPADVLRDVIFVMLVIVTVIAWARWLA